MTFIVADNVEIYILLIISIGLKIRVAFTDCPYNTEKLFVSFPKINDFLSYLLQYKPKMAINL